jgi:Na+-translocating ferredoxin:NAD+ oxidoreductase RNF subunit RnfB/uncharacterized membrane protein
MPTPEVTMLVSALVVMGFLGLAFGIGLAYAARVFHVEVDPRVEQVEDILPGANCGACGQPGCSGYAQAVVAGTSEITMCSPGGPDVVARIAEILGQEAGEFVPKVAVIQCVGGLEAAPTRADYGGVRTCSGAEIVAGGDKKCVFGCLGYGDCVAACTFDAIAMSDDRLPVVFEDVCTACGACVDACPRGIVKIIPKSQPIYVGCVNRDKGKDVKQVCTVGCTGCGVCSPSPRSRRPASWSWSTTSRRSPRTGRTSRAPSASAPRARSSCAGRARRRPSPRRRREPRRRRPRRPRRRRRPRPRRRARMPLAESESGPEKRRAAEGCDFEGQPLTRLEYIQATIQYYRGEMHRALVWRQRLDRTTNWAIVTTGGVLSFSLALGAPVIILLGEVLVLHFMVIEARRYRYFDLWNTRVRKIEENFFAPLLVRTDLESRETGWGRHLAHDLFDPHYKVSFIEALGLRLVKNYLPVFVLLAGLWIVNVIVAAEKAVGEATPTFGDVYREMRVGPIPPWFVLVTFLAFQAMLFVILVWMRLRPEHVSEEVEGVELWPHPEDGPPE